jgi:hypothetical protein
VIDDGRVVGIDTPTDLAPLIDVYGSPSRDRS